MQKLKVAILLVVVMLSVISTNAQSSGQTYTGTLTIAIIDNFDEHEHEEGHEEHATEYKYVLAMDDGSRVTLNISDALVASFGGHEALNHQRVTVAVNPTFSRAPGVAAEVTSLQALGAVAPKAMPANQKWLNLLCQVTDADVPVAPYPPTHFGGDAGQMFADTFPGLSAFYVQQSYNNITNIDVTTTNWLPLGQSHAYYFESTSDEFDLLQDCLALAVAADPSLDMNQFYGINLFWNYDYGSAFAYVGGYPITLNGVERTDWRLTWNPHFAFTQSSVVAHEMGHAYGWFHSNNYDGDANEYDNPWDLMSGDRLNCEDFIDNNVECPSKHTNAFHKRDLGWIPQEDIFTFDEIGTEDILIEALELPTTSAEGYRMAFVPVGPDRAFTIEVRGNNYLAPEVNFDKRLPGTGVIIYDVDPGYDATNPAWQLGGINDDESFTGEGMWVVGETYEEPSTGTTITIKEQTSTGFRVVISRARILTSKATLCEVGQTPLTPIYVEDFETVAGVSEWSTQVLGYTINPWRIQDPRALSGNFSLFGQDVGDFTDAVATLNQDIAIPNGPTTYLYFDHAYSLESTYDGGALEYSTDGGTTWTPVPASFFDSGKGYDTVLDVTGNGNTNALNGVAVFSGDTNNYPVSSRLNLSSLAGQNVRFRFHVATDLASGGVNEDGWFIDNFQVYNCGGASTVGDGFKLLKPVDGAQFTSLSQLSDVRWEALEGAETYTILVYQIGGAGSGEVINYPVIASEVCNDAGVCRVDIDTSELFLTFGDYRWTVVATDASARDYEADNASFGFSLLAELNVVDNGGFEDGPRVSPVSWTANPTATGKRKCNNVNNPDFAYEGDCAYMLRPGTRLVQVIGAGDLYAGADVTFSLFVRNSVVRNKVGMLKVNYVSDLDDNGRPDVDKIMLNAATTNATYAELSTSTTLDANEVRKARVILNHAGPSGKIFVDSVSVNVSDLGAGRAVEGILPLPAAPAR